MKIARRLLAAGILLVQYSASASIIGYWRFEDGGGATAADQTGVFQGELAGSWDSYDPGAGDTGVKGWSANVFAATVPQSGAPNSGSLRFAGSSHFVDLSNGQDLYLGTSFTMEFFMNPDQPIIGSSVFGFSGFSSAGLALTESLGVLYWNMGFNSEQPYTLALGVETGVWQHVALVKQPGQYSIYINGILQASDSVGSAGDGPYYFPGTDITGDRVIGGDSGSFRGYLDEFRISDTALTPDQFLIVPEPGTLGLLLLGLGALAARSFSNRWKL